MAMTVSDLIAELSHHPGHKTVTLVVNLNDGMSAICTGDVTLTSDQDHPEEIILEGDDD